MKDAWSHGVGFRLAVRRSLPPLVQADPVAQRTLRPRFDQHHARLVADLTVKIDRTCNTMPRFDAQKRRAARFGPDAEFLCSLP